MKVAIQKVSAVTLKVGKMETSLRFYRDVLGMEVLYGGPKSGFSSLRIPGTEFPIINLQLGDPTVAWGRIVFHVTDVDAFWSHLTKKGFTPDRPKDASWGERYFHVHDPDGYELSFARLL